jgi:hypothetical protein
MQYDTQWGPPKGKDRNSGITSLVCPMICGNEEVELEVGLGYPKSLQVSRGTVPPSRRDGCSCMTLDDTMGPRDQEEKLWNHLVGLSHHLRHEEVEIEAGLGPARGPESGTGVSTTIIIIVSDDNHHYHHTRPAVGQQAGRGGQARQSSSSTKSSSSSYCRLRVRRQSTNGGTPGLYCS